MKAVARIGCIHCCTAAHLPDESSQVGGCPQLLALRWLPPREPAVPVAYALTQLGPLNTELSAVGGSAFQAFVPLVSGLLHMPKVLRRWPLTRLSEHDGLLICAIRSDARCAGVMVTIAPKQPSATLSHDLLILSDLHSHPPGTCGRWLPVWLPGISLATLMFECLRPKADLLASPASGPIRLSHTVPVARSAAAGTRAGCRERGAGLDLSCSLN